MVTTVVCTDRAAFPATVSAVRVVRAVLAGTASCIAAGMALSAWVAAVVVAGSVDAWAIVATFGPGQVHTPSATVSSAMVEDAC